MQHKQYNLCYLTEIFVLLYKMFKNAISYYITIKGLLIIYFLVFVQTINGQELPPIYNFTPETYKAESQNWSIDQSEEGHLYVANNLGLLEFNGATWNLYKTPNATIMRSVKSIDDKVFTGFYMDFGYWQRDLYGVLNYISLVKENNISILEDEQFWNIIQYDDWILFQSLQRIYFFNPTTKEYKIISSDVKITKLFKVNNTIYFHQFGKGLYMIKDGDAVLVSNHEIFKSNDIINIHKEDNHLLLLTNSKGFVKLINNQIKLWDPPNRYLKNKKIYNSVRLKNEGFAIGTISNGVLFLTKEGEIEYEFSLTNGLINNTVLSLFEDNRGKIWLGLDDGINSIDINSQIKVFKDTEGSIGSVYASIVFEKDLYLGTNQGLFVKRYGSNEKFKIIEGTQGQVWSLNKIDNHLFCGHDSGTFIIKNRRIINSINVLGTWDVKKINEQTLLQGNYTGLYILEKRNDKWRLKNKLKGFNNSSRSFELLDDLIFVNHEYKGIFVLKPNANYNQLTQIHKDTVVGKGFHSNIIKYKEAIYYSDFKGVFKYVKEDKSFQRDSILSRFYSKEEYKTGKIIFDNNNNKLWSFSKKHISYAKPNTINQKISVKKIAISEQLRKGAQGFENLYFYDNQYILGVNNGYILINTNINNQDKIQKLTINSIKRKELDREYEYVQLNKEGTFTSKQNNFKFDFNIPYLTHDVNVEYQYLLKGYTQTWSKWSTNPSASFENLPYGNEYTFLVKAKIGLQDSNTASYTFSIKNPWFLTNTAIAAYVITVILFLLLIDRLYKNYYRKQRKRLLEKQEKDFKLQSLASEKELIQARNEQLKIDVESKNRELATSTMSIIKKNELLSTIKKELVEGQDQGQKNVIKIIDRNLNNNDDWQMFKQAFNNADKDFIKKLKTLHTTLTPNDLRLCAYLRLNLSSKEIAPLLNISPRSVEVKRYRLRKKMNLEHNDSLTDYILSI